jgi:acetyl-CoA carboxylase carboxyltransferase component
MCGRSYDPRFLFSWPIGRCSVMGPDQLSGVMGTIAREAAARFGAHSMVLMLVMGRK